MMSALVLAVATGMGVLQHTAGASLRSNGECEAVSCR